MTMIGRAINKIGEARRKGHGAMTISDSLGKMKNDNGFLAGFKNSWNTRNQGKVEGTFGDVLEAFGDEISDEAMFNIAKRLKGSSKYLEKNGIKSLDDISLEEWAELQDKKINLGLIDRIKLAHMDFETGEYSAKKIAGSAAATYFTGASAFRLASGGGIYKDADGNTNIIGIPGI